nr:hypothetical protein [Tanacetum cinerariifolium]
MLYMANLCVACATCGQGIAPPLCAFLTINNYLTRGAGFVWGMMVEVMGSSGGGGEEAGNVGEGSCRFNGNLGTGTVILNVV